MDRRQRIGRRGEAEAARFLRRRGFVIVDQNVRSRLGEIDLVARDGDTLVFVEVKARRGEQGDPPQAGVTPRKQARLGRLALSYLKARRLSEVRCRFDVVGITVDEEDRVAAIRHLPGAFELTGW